MRFNTQPRGGGCLCIPFFQLFVLAFQHTAARRRLRELTTYSVIMDYVSTHSRAEAAAVYSHYFKPNL